MLACIAERAFLRKLEGGCSVPVAVTSQVLPTGIRLTGGVWSLDGRQHVGGERLAEFPAVIEGNKEENSSSSANLSVMTYAAICALNLVAGELAAAEQCGLVLAEELIGQGAEKILREAKAQNEAK